MDYEKAYNEALERAKKVLLDCTSEERKAVEYAFPELREDDDEKIREFLYEFIKICAWSEKQYPPREKCLAYLEKQKEQKTDGKAMLHVAEKSYQIGLRDRRMEQKAEPFSCGHENGDSERPNNQWSEEDEKMRENLLYLMLENNSQDSWEGTYEWLKSFRPQPHWKPSKREMDAFETALKGEFQNGVYPASTLCELFGELKKLYYNDEIPPHWKPTEEQMEALEFACTIREGERNYYLHTLFDDLSKL